MLRIRLVIAICAALGALSVAPAAAGACASLAGVHAFHGHAFISFDESASGPIEGSGSSETISLRRKGASLELNLPHKTVGKGELDGIVIFSGKVRLGHISVEDEFNFSNGGAGSEIYSGPALPPLGLASVVLDTNDCVYAVTAGFGAKTMFSGDGDLRPSAAVSLSAIGDQEKIPKSLHLVGGVGPEASLSCPEDALLKNKPCIQIAGGWATDFAELKQCGSFPPQGDCASPDKPVGDGKFLWVLKPKK